MNTLLFSITTSPDNRYTDEELVSECMNGLMARWPEIAGYQWERDDDHINILMWGDIGGD